MKASSVASFDRASLPRARALDQQGRETARGRGRRRLGRWGKRMVNAFACDGDSVKTSKDVEIKV
jgi:hypothetical protein